MKKVLSLVLSVFLALGVFTPVLAQEEEVVVEEVNSFELFWPVVAGRTMGDSLYPLKTLKENVRGLLIFGKAQKAEYSVFLATKRAVEAEKLLNEGKNDLAAQTLDSAFSLLEKAENNVGQAGSSISAVVDEMNNKLANLEVFLPWLASKNESSRDKIQAVLDKVGQLHQKI